MKKLTLLLVATALISGGSAYAQSCCKKGGHCTKSAACKKACAKDANKVTNNNTKAVKAEPAKKSS